MAVASRGQLVVWCVVCVLKVPQQAVLHWSCLLAMMWVVQFALCSVLPLPGSHVCLQVLTDLRRLGGRKAAYLPSCSGGTWIWVPGLSLG
jgi:hypothetical protein